MLAQAIVMIGELMSGSQTGASTVESGDTALPPGSFLLGALALLVVFACLLAAFKVHTAIRGGRLGQGWLFLTFGFTVLGSAQLLLFIGQVGLVPLWLVWVDALRVVSLLLLLIGVSRIRKVLA
ncbi:MAG: hypothetical protein AB1792_06570 [Candidatus Zixiibacteriota bacterium]